MRRENSIKCKGQGWQGCSIAHLLADTGPGPTDYVLAPVRFTWIYLAA